jgi:hypothetical protein
LLWILDWCIVGTVGKSEKQLALVPSHP